MDPADLTGHHEPPEQATRTCSICAMRQFDTASGVTCPNGHGGAPSAPAPNYSRKPATVEELERVNARLRAELMLARGRIAYEETRAEGYLRACTSLREGPALHAVIRDYERQARDAVAAAEKMMAGAEHIRDAALVAEAYRVAVAALRAAKTDLRRTHVFEALDRELARIAEGA